MTSTCATCKHWERTISGHWDAHPCAVLDQDFCCSGHIVPHPTPADPYHYDHVPPSFPAGCTGGGSFESRPMFGCNLWEQAV